MSLPQLKARGVELRAGLDWLQRLTKTEKKEEVDARKRAKDKEAELAKLSKGKQAKTQEASKSLGKRAAKPAKKGRSDGGGDSSKLQVRPPTEYPPISLGSISYPPGSNKTRANKTRHHHRKHALSGGGQEAADR